MDAFFALGQALGGLQLVDRNHPDNLLETGDPALDLGHRVLPKGGHSLLDRYVVQLAGSQFLDDPFTDGLARVQQLSCRHPAEIAGLGTGVTAGAGVEFILFRESRREAGKGARGWAGIGFCIGDKWCATGASQAPP